MIHPEDAAPLGIEDGVAVTLGNMRGETTLTAKLFDGVRRGVLIAESVHPNKAHMVAAASICSPAPKRSRRLAARLSTTTRSG